LSALPKYVDEIHQNRPILVKDLPIFGKPVYLKVPRRQFECKRCKRDDRSIRIFIHTADIQNVQKRVYLPSSSGDKYRQVCREEQVKYDEVKGIFDYVSKQHQNWQPVKQLMKLVCGKDNKILK